MLFGSKKFRLIPFLILLFLLPVFARAAGTEMPGTKITASTYEWRDRVIYSDNSNATQVSAAKSFIKNTLFPLIEKEGKASGLTSDQIKRLKRVLTGNTIDSSLGNSAYRLKVLGGAVWPVTNDVSETWHKITTAKSKLEKDVVCVGKGCYAYADFISMYVFGTSPDPEKDKNRMSLVPEGKGVLFNSADFLKYYPREELFPGKHIHFHFGSGNKKEHSIIYLATDPYTDEWYVLSIGMNDTDLSKGKWEATIYTVANEVGPLFIDKTVNSGSVDPNDPLQRFSFTLKGTDSNGKSRSYTLKTDANGHVELHDIPVGNYVLHEVLTDAQKAAGYKAIADKNVKINAGKQTYYSIDNVGSPQCYVKKTIAEGGTGIFEFRITKNDGSWSTTFKTSRNGEATCNLKPGDPVGVYTIEEINLPAGYVPQPSQQFEIVAGEYLHEVEFVNRHVPGSITVAKTVDDNGGGLQSDAFSFRITLTVPEGVDFDWSTLLPLVFTNGVAEFTLGGGESVSLLDLPMNTAYTVEEISAASGTDYGTTIRRTIDGVSESLSGKKIEGSIVSADQNIVINYSNVFPTGELNVVKNIIGSGDMDVFQFRFRLRLTPPAGFDAEKFRLNSGMYGSVWLDDSYEGTFTLSAPTPSITVSGLPQGWKYEITELDHFAFDSRKKTVTGTVDGDPATVQTETFTNVRQVGSLLITKELKGIEWPKKLAFKFAVDFTDEISGDYGRIIRDGAAVRTVSVSGGHAEFTLNEGESILFEDLPAGISGTCSETKTVYSGGGDPFAGGSFTVEYVYNSGEETGYFYIVKDEETLVRVINTFTRFPVTGDDSPVTLFILLGLTGLVSLIFLRRRMKELR